MHRTADPGSATGSHEPSTIDTEATEGSRDAPPERIRGRPRYEVVRKLGAGGMAEVYLCNMLAGEGVTRLVALKRLREDLAQRPTLRAALSQEARFAALLTHPNIVHVLDLDEDERGHLFLIMEYIDGVDLVRLAAGRAVPPPVAIYVASEVLRGLGYAHALPDGAGPIRGILHRDVSPQNVLVDRYGAVKLADFGIAKAISAGGCHSGVQGKAAYMSPEQAASKPLDARSDLFSLGVVLWELLTGRRMFAGQHPKDILTHLVLGPIPAPSRYVAIAPDLEAVTMRLLAKARDDRYPTARDAIAALLACADAPKDGPGVLAAYLATRFSSSGAMDPLDPSCAAEPSSPTVTATEPTPTPEGLLRASAHTFAPGYAPLIRRILARCRTFVIGRARVSPSR